MYWRDVYFRLYCHYLNIQRHTFINQIIADIGCGPHGAVGCFEAKLKFAIDPLVGVYNNEFDLLDQKDVIYLNCGAENVPLIDGLLDVVISRNSLDHVDNVENVIEEVHRLLRKGGEIYFAINYQESPTICEPHVFNDNILHQLFSSKFDYHIEKRFPKDYDSCIGGAGQFKYPHDIVLIKGVKKWE